jgi:hypothetical protein
MKHTPGPWSMRSREERDGKTVDIVATESGQVIVAGVCGDPSLYGQSQNACNAQLMAAAPELLDQLKSVLACIEAAGECLGNMDAMRVAIAKAEAA